MESRTEEFIRQYKIVGSFDEYSLQKNTLCKRMLQRSHDLSDSHDLVLKTTVLVSFDKQCGLVCRKIGLSAKNCSGVTN